MCVGVVSNAAIPSDISAVATVIGAGYVVTPVVRPGAAGAHSGARAPDALEAVADAVISSATPVVSGADGVATATVRLGEGVEALCAATHWLKVLSLPLQIVMPWVRISDMMLSLLLWLIPLRLLMVFLRMSMGRESMRSAMSIGLPHTPRRRVLSERV